MSVRFTQLPLIHQITVTRDQLLAKLNAVNEGKFVITIGDALEREGEETKRLVKPLLKQTLRSSIDALERELAELDVDVLG